MQVKRNLVRRQPTQSQIDALEYPKDRFQLLSVDHVDQWQSQSCVYAKGTKKVHRYKHRSVYITCKCRKCGHVKQVVDKPTIGCKQGPCNVRWIDYSGVKQGQLTVIRPVFRSYKQGKQQKWYWQCQCSCGRITYTDPHALSMQTKHYCQVCARQKVIEQTRLPGNLAVWHRVFKDTRNNAKKRGYQVQLDFQTFKQIAQRNCYYCGCQPKLGSYGIARNGVDRLDNTIGYTKDNCVPCCGMCNIMKRDHTQQAFLLKVHQIYSLHKDKINDYLVREQSTSVLEAVPEQLQLF